MTPAAILAALLTLSPHPSAHPLPGWAETEDAHRARLASIAEDVASVARTPAEAAILVGIGWHESGWQPDVDAMSCYRGPGWERRCDGGRAWTAYQMQTSDPEQIAAWRDRKVASREALRRALGSLRRCAKNSPETRLAAFASGSCEHGHKAARELHAAVRRALVTIDAAGAS